MPAWLRTLLGLLRRAPAAVDAAEQVVDIVSDVVDPDEPGVPLSRADVEHQQAQIRAATRPPARKAKP